LEPGFPIEDYLRAVSERVEPRLAALAGDGRAAGPPRLAEAVRYALLGGGKRLRPALVLASFEAHGGEHGSAASDLAFRFAVSVEAIHAYSLVHDDLPSMDDDDLRRGRPTVHRAFDEATAILAGDALQALAFRNLLASPDPAVPELGRLLAEAAYRMVEGQMRDIAGEHARLGEAEVTDLMATKTGALVAASVAGGAACAGAQPGPAHRIGLDLGLAFQIADDLLDLTADSATLGKRTGKDAEHGKSTLHGVVGPDEARRRAEGLVDRALSGLVPLGPRAEPLRALARFVYSRKK